MKKFTFYLDHESKEMLEQLSNNKQFKYNQSKVLRHLIGYAYSEYCQENKDMSNPLNDEQM